MLQSPARSSPESKPIASHVREAFAIAVARVEAKKRLVANRITRPDDELRFTKADGTTYEPLGDGQRAFLASTARVAAFVGGRGSGKTAAGIQKGAPRIWRGLDGAIVGPNVPHFSLSTWPEAERWIPWNLVTNHNKQHKRLTFSTGANVWYGGIEDPDAWRGPNLNWVWFDEAARKMDRGAFDVLLATVRVGPSPQMWITTTPRGIGHWLYNVLHRQQFSDDPEESERVLMALRAALGDQQLIETFHGSIDQNADNLDPAYYASLKAIYVGLMAEQELEGRFVGLEGLVFDNWTTDNVDDLAEYDPARSIEWWVDDGYAHGGGPGSASYHPRVVLFAQERSDGGVNVIGECYQTQALAERTVADCLGVRVEALDRWPNLKDDDRHDAGAKLPGLSVGASWPWPAPEIAYVDSSAVELKARIWELGIQTFGATHSVEEGVKVTRSFVRDGNDRALLRVHPRCRNLIREMQSLHYAEGDAATARQGTGQPKPVKIDDHGCFAAGTLVTTARGDIPIESVVVGDRAWTRYGWRLVTRQAQTGSLVPVVTLTTSDGRALRGTPNHPVWIDGRGWVPLNGLRYGDRMLVWQSTESCLVASSIGVTQTAQRFLSEPTTGEHTRVDVKRTYTGPSGKPRMERSRVDGTFIIGTETRSTTTSQTLSRLRALRINDFTSIRVIRRDWQRRKGQRCIGTGRRRGERGIACTAHGFGRMPRFGTTSVTSAARVTDLGMPTPRAPGFVQTGVKAHGVVLKGSIMSPSHASFVGSSSRRIDTIELGSAPDYVEHVDDLGERADVFNLTVEGAHEYIANGILVSNCDCTRYGLWTRRYQA